MSLGDVLGIAAASATVAGGGVGFGRFTSEAYRTRRKESATKTEEERKRREEEIQMRWAILGRPKTDWNDAAPGLRDVVADLVQTLSDHRREDASLFDDLRRQVGQQGDRLSAHIDSRKD